ncbi:MAG: SDR family NAD(P)-dependent oxidoreductase [Candidatus Nanosalina sp.]
MRIFLTGAAGGIGSEAAKKLVEDSHKVIAYDCDKEGLEQLPSSVKTYQGDIKDEERLNEVVRGEIFDTLVNCAGIQKQGAVEDMDIEDFREHIEVNYIGALNAVKAALPMIKERQGKIVNVSSVAGIYGAPFLGAYSGSKHAVEGVTESLRLELRASNVDVVLFEPGPVKTGFNEKGRTNLRNYVSNSPYSGEYESKLEEEPEGISPRKAGLELAKVVGKNSPRPRHSPTTRFHWLVKLRSLIPWRIREFFLGNR